MQLSDLSRNLPLQYKNNLVERMNPLFGLCPRRNSCILFGRFSPGVGGTTCRSHNQPISPPEAHDKHPSFFYRTVIIKIVCRSQKYLPGRYFRLASMSSSSLYQRCNCVHLLLLAWNELLLSGSSTGKALEVRP